MKAQRLISCNGVCFILLLKSAPSELVYIRRTAPEFSPYFVLFNNGNVLLNSKTSPKIEMWEYMGEVPYYFPSCYSTLGCSPSFNISLHSSHVRTNSEANEQQNAVLKKLKPQVSYMTPHNFVETLKLYIWHKNSQKNIVLAKSKQFDENLWNLVSRF